MLVTEGKEQNTLKGILATKDDTNQKISKSPEIDRALYRHSPRLIPPEFNPQCVETFIKITHEEPKASTSTAGVSTRSRKKVIRLILSLSFSLSFQSKYVLSSFTFRNLRFAKSKQHQKQHRPRLEVDCVV